MATILPIKKRTTVVPIKKRKYDFPEEESQENLPPLLPNQVWFSGTVLVPQFSDYIWIKPTIRKDGAKIPGHYRRKKSKHSKK